MYAAYTHDACLLYIIIYNMYYYAYYYINWFAILNYYCYYYYLQRYFNGAIVKMVSHILDNVVVYDGH